MLRLVIRGILPRPPERPRAKSAGGEGCGRGRTALMECRVPRPERRKERRREPAQRKAERLETTALRIFPRRRPSSTGDGPPLTLWPKSWPKRPAGGIPVFVGRPGPGGTDYRPARADFGAPRRASGAPQRSSVGPGGGTL